MLNSNMLRFLSVLFILQFCVMSIRAHGSFIEHSEDMMDVLGFEPNTKLFSRSKDTRSNDSWTKYISSDMIDNTDFHKKLQNEHYNFHISSSYYHRLLFHWGYNAEPWSKDLEDHIKEYCYKYDLNVESNIRIFKSKLKQEQKRRNKLMDTKTQKLFGFSSGGKDRKYAQFFTSMAYNIHLLGDYQTGNKVFEGLPEMNKLIGQIINSLRMLDDVKSKPIEKEISRINQQYVNPQEKADKLMDYLKTSVPKFIKEAQKGSIYRRIEKQGFKFKI